MQGFVALIAPILLLAQLGINTTAVPTTLTSLVNSTADTPVYRNENNITGAAAKPHNDSAFDLIMKANEKNGESR